MGGDLMQHWRGVTPALEWMARQAIAPVVIAWLTVAAVGEEARWFPEQAVAKTVVRTIPEDEFPEPRLANRMMVQSVAGLAAKAVNAGQGDEMVWVGTRNADVEAWYARLLGR